MGWNIMTINIDPIISAALEAGREIMTVYQNTIDVEYKEDKSPLTEADKRSHNIIKKRLAALHPDIPILSEEGADIPYEVRKDWNRYFLIDPLDGTKEFIKRNGEFTVNIALIEDQSPVLGVVYAPAVDVLYHASRNEGVFRKSGEFETKKIEPKPYPDSGPISVVGSRSHQSPPFHEYVERLKEQYSPVTIVSKGSSLKICLVADGTADTYPRLGPTMEWDTAAAHAIANEAGKKLYRFQTSEELSYNKKELLNDWFIVK